MSPKVLIVDDSQVMRRMIRRVLAMCGFPNSAIRETGDAEAALELLADGGVDLLLTDLNFPGMSGIELIEMIERIPAACGVRIVTISTESCEKRIRSLAKRGVYFVHKPFTPEKIKEKVELALGVREHA